MTELPCGCVDDDEYGCKRVICDTHVADADAERRQSRRMDEAA